MGSGQPLFVEELHREELTGRLELREKHLTLSALAHAPHDGEVGESKRLRSRHPTPGG